jgi:hypothetical protein
MLTLILMKAYMHNSTRADLQPHWRNYTPSTEHYCFRLEILFYGRLFYALPYHSLLMLSMLTPVADDLESSNDLTDGEEAQDFSSHHTHAGQRSTVKISELR